MYYDFLFASLPNKLNPLWILCFNDNQELITILELSLFMLDEELYPPPN